MAILYKSSKKNKKDKKGKKENNLKNFADKMNRRSKDYKLSKVPFIQTK